MSKPALLAVEAGFFRSNAMGTGRELDLSQRDGAGSRGPSWAATPGAA